MAKLITTQAMRAKWGKINARRKAAGKPVLNFPLWIKTRNRIDAIPESYYQGDWSRASSEAPCGTTACLAGEAIICDSVNIKEGVRRLNLLTRSDRAGEEAVELLGLKTRGSDPSSGEGQIFYYDARGWPLKFRSRFTNASSQLQRARAAVAFLTHVIRTGKVTG